MSYTHSIPLCMCGVCFPLFLTINKFIARLYTKLIRSYHKINAHISFLIFHQFQKWKIVKRKTNIIIIIIMFLVLIFIWFSLLLIHTKALVEDRSDTTFCNATRWRWYSQWNGIFSTFLFFALCISWQLRAYSIYTHRTFQLHHLHCSFPTTKYLHYMASNIVYYEIDIAIAHITK